MNDSWKMFEQELNDNGRLEIVGDIPEVGEEVIFCTKDGGWFVGTFESDLDENGLLIFYVDEVGLELVTDITGWLPVPPVLNSKPSTEKMKGGK